MWSGSSGWFAGVAVLFRAGFQIGLKSFLFAPSRAGERCGGCPFSIHFRIVGTPPSSAKQSNPTVQALACWIPRLSSEINIYNAVR
jgi:hypothetical protein